MPSQTFNYTALDADGKRTRGAIIAAAESHAYRQLAEKGLTPVRLKQAQSGASFLSPSSISQVEIAALTREMSVLIEANIPIARGLQSIAQHEKNPRLRDMVTDIAAMIEAGERLTEAFGRYEDVFGEVYIETMRAAEKSGKLASVTNHLAEMLERNIETRQQVRRAMTYPLIVMAFVALAVGVIVIFVVPRFAVIFESNNVPLPLTTRVVRSLGVTLTEYWYLFLAVGLGSIITLKQAWANPRGRFRIEQFMLMLPYVGTMLTAVTTARFARVLSISLDSGIEVIEAISIAGKSTGRPVFVAECDDMCGTMRAGESLESVLNSSKRLPSFARRLLGAGKESSELAGAGRIIARHFDRISDHLAKNINTIIEPMITIAIAFIVLLIALAVFMPMWQMVSINK